jgi:hypothetical protein
MVSGSTSVLIGTAEQQRAAICKSAFFQSQGRCRAALQTRSLLMTTTAQRASWRNLSGCPPIDCESSTLQRRESSRRKRRWDQSTSSTYKSRELTKNRDYTHQCSGSACGRTEARYVTVWQGRNFSPVRRGVTMLQSRTLFPNTTGICIHTNPPTFM